MTGLQRRLTALLTLSLALVAMPAGISQAAPGDLDPTFNDDGAQFDVLSPNPFDGIRDPRSDQAPDGSLVAGVLTEGCGQEGCTGNRTFTGFLHVNRFADNGAIADTEEIPIEDVGDLFDLRVLGDGTTTIAMRFDDVGLMVTRLDAALDEISTEIYEPDECVEIGRIRDAAIRADGTVAGLWNECFVSKGPDQPMVDLVDGDAEPVDGFTQTFLGEDMSTARDLALRPDGVIHVLGEEFLSRGFSGLIVVARLLMAGGLDDSYDEDGFAEHSLGESPTSNVGAFAVDGGGRAIVGLNSDNHEWRLLALDAAGEVDETFGTDGVASVEDERIGDDVQHLTIQRDGKILVTGFEGDPRPSGRGAPSDNGITLGRLSTNGAFDAGFGTGGLVVIELNDPDRWLRPVGPALQQADNKIVVPAGLPFERFDEIERATVTAPAESASYLAMFRVLGDPVEQQQQQQQVQQQTQNPVVQQQQQQPRRCASRRTLRIRLRTGRPKGEKSPIVKARVIVRGKRVRVTRRNGRHTALINLRKLPPGRFSVKIRLRLADGGKVRETRRYRTCAKKIRRQLAPLRTRAPKSARD